jgi:hypothetical protein
MSLGQGGAENSKQKLEDWILQYTAEMYHLNTSCNKQKKKNYSILFNKKRANKNY